jgi:UDP-N-acetylglucosamine 1-carboxyvinyltransferase
MDKIIVEGGARLSGELKVSGAKNAALPIMAAGLLPSGASTFSNVPALNDITTMKKLLRRLGCEVDDAGHEVTIEPPNSTASTRKKVFEAPYELVKTMRASVLVLGPLVARYGRARVSLPGGCAIGARPIDQHLKGLEAMGAKVELDEGYVVCTARKRLHGARIVLDIPTVTGCENLMMAAALARGQTVIENAAREPEVEELAQVLNKMGGRVTGAGSPVIEIDGVDELRPIEHAVGPDRIEAGTFLVAAAITHGNVLVQGARPEHLDAVLEKLRDAGVAVSIEAQGIRVKPARENFHPLKITTQPYPGFPTDMQAQFMVMAAISRGQSVIKEAIFENRFMHVPELLRMGADISADGRVAMVRGVPRLSGATVMATDLRASASLVLAGLVARGKTEVLRVYHLDRGYERIEKKLKKAGAKIRRARA